jgi:hypothetical protein
VLGNEDAPPTGSLPLIKQNTQMLVVWLEDFLAPSGYLLRTQSEVPGDFNRFAYRRYR